MYFPEPTVLSADDLGVFTDVRHEDARFTERAAYLREFLRQGPRALAGAQDLERLVIGTGDQLIPIVVNDGREDTCYILSPFSHYVRYAQAELAKMGECRTARVMTRALGLMGRIYLPLGFNRCVSINNWLFTTNPSLRLTPRELGRITALLVDRFPGYPLVIRSVDARDGAARRLLRDAGYRLIVNRPVHEWDPARLTKRHRHKVRSDLRLLRDSRVVVSCPAVLGSGDAQRIASLYRQLYIVKHSRFNVDYTPQFFDAVHRSNLMQLGTISIEGRIAAFISYFDDGDRVVAALVGYDTALDPREYPLYRLAMATMFAQAWRRGRVLFLSTGAASFKLQRGTTEWIEHEAVHDLHLPLLRRAPWASFSRVLRFGEGRLNTSRM
ncbi:GNAT family N-acetyltransferase [Sorangium sp. So ce136]|uniref:GNAT family N-acetyltransferase n=1 Tax=Sorangium sp. So ce136 TaxID=3133284 RepID=UPI003F07FEFA